MSTFQLIELTQETPAVVVQVKEPHLCTGIVAEMLENELRQVIQQAYPTLLVLDLVNVRMVSSSTIGVLLKIRGWLQAHGGQLRLCRVSIPIAEVYRTLNLTGSRLPVFDTVEQAVSARLLVDDSEREVMED